MSNETIHDLVLNLEAGMSQEAAELAVFEVPCWEINLKCLNEPLKGHHWSFKNVFRIGRLDSVDLRLIEPEGSMSVSRLHAMIWHDDQHWWVADLKSTNGTSLNGKKVLGQVRLRPFDMLQFGQVWLRVEALCTPTNLSAPRPFDAPRAAESLNLPHLGRFCVGEPSHYKSLTVFPLFGDDNPIVEYLLSDEAIESGVVTVAEVTQQGSVPELAVTNQGDRRVLFLEGEELRGAKQNRILNTSVLVPALSSLKIPVSCVEQGRWQHNSTSLSSSKTVCPARLRRILKTTVSRSLQAQRGHCSDQATIWGDVRTQHDSLCVTSTTLSLSDTCFMYEHHIAEGRQNLEYVEGCSGLVVAIGSLFVSADFFNNPDTCRKVWPRLLSGLMLDDLLHRGSGERPEIAQVGDLLQKVQRANWTQVQTVGEGEEQRAAFNGMVGSSLQFQGALVHGSVVCEM